MQTRKDKISVEFTEEEALVIQRMLVLQKVSLMAKVKDYMSIPEFEIIARLADRVDTKIHEDGNWCDAPDCSYRKFKAKRKLTTN